MFRRFVGSITNYWWLAKVVIHSVNKKYQDKLIMQPSTLCRPIVEKHLRNTTDNSNLVNLPSPRRNHMVNKSMTDDLYITMHNEDGILKNFGNDNASSAGKLSETSWLIFNPYV